MSCSARARVARKMMRAYTDRNKNLNSANHEGWQGVRAWMMSCRFCGCVLAAWPEPGLSGSETCQSTLNHNTVRLSSEKESQTKRLFAMTILYTSWKTRWYANPHFPPSRQIPSSEVFAKRQGFIRGRPFISSLHRNRLLHGSIRSRGSFVVPFRDSPLARRWPTSFSVPRFSPTESQKFMLMYSTPCALQSASTSPSIIL